MRRSFSFLSALILTLFLAACDTAEERAEEHFQSALSLLEEGDVDRAIVELRSVFALVPNHLEARHELARIFLEERGRPQQAYNQYLRIVEQYPEDLKARIEVAEMSFFVANWEGLSRHGQVARELGPDEPRVKAISAALDYRAALEDENEIARAAVVSNAEALVADDSESRILRELLLDNVLREQELTQALSMLDGMTADFPDTKQYWLQRLQVLIAIGDQAGIEAQLIDLVDRFPDDDEQKQLLIRYFLSRGELDKTESFLRELVDEAPDGETGARVDLIRFLTELRSVDQARTEILDAIENEEDPYPFIMLGASLDFTTGDVDKAIDDLETAIEDAEASDQTNTMKVALAQMLLVKGNEVAARSLVETVLLDDATQVGALKLNAGWLIEADDTDAAIAALRTALDKEPNDPDAMSLMARAYTRAGSVDLARDFLALAVEASGNAPTETVRYAQQLISEERYLPAEDVLLPALRIEPNNLELLRTAAQLYLGMEDLGRMQQVIETLRRIDSDESNRMAVQLEAARLNETAGAEEAIGYLEALADSADADIASRILLLRARVSMGDTEAAVELAEGLVEDEPDLPAVKMVLATTLSVAGEFDRAMEIYRALLEDFPQEIALYVEIAGLHARNGDPAAARATIDEALVKAPNDPRLLWASASYLEADGDIDAAIDIYEDLYELDSNNLIVANNLASLLATYRDDEESLNRAWTIARRFQDSDLAAIQDTYGWIAHRRGDSEGALPYLQAAAAGLVTDPIVQFHLAEALYATGRLEEAAVQYRVTLDGAGVGDTRSQFGIARERLTEIEASQTAAE
ncbi:tetratricopeptide repeat protein [Octadecabacter sp. CECT 8868]|uniref:tetratricopeptide repeat protein n=1 Tax=Octadecabacter algicola TaxID=2909342 RepID=UPI001F1B2A8D|nr:tetratricopeptide repeat protein [Octadecabacter algicola]MCF2906688.1 tetratricopeptide repeat protein [Octadecabacter algicola]